MSKQRAMDDPTVRVELTERQVEVLRGIARGRTNAEIAEDLGVSLDGVKWHVREILQRLGADSREEAVELWKQENSLRQRVSAWLGWPLAAGAGGAAAVGVAAFVLMATLGGGDDGRSVTPPEMTPTPAQEEVLAVLETGDPVDDASASIGSNDVEFLATYEGIRFYAALERNRGKTVVALVAWAPTPDGAPDRLGTRATTGATPPQFTKRGASMDLALVGFPRVTAYLLPDGYGDAAKSVPGTELLSPNLLVVTDHESAPDDVIHLAASEPELDDLELPPLGNRPIGSRHPAMRDD